MPDVQIDWVGVVVATAAAMVIGGVWYTVLAEPWMGYIGKTREELRGNGPLGYGFALLGAFVQAIVLTYVTQWANADGFGKGALVGLVMWAGFLVSTLVTGSIFEGRAPGLIAINGGNALLTFFVVGGIVAAFH